MSSPSDLPRQVLRETAEAIDSLMQHIEGILSEMPEGRKLYLIALARKMPRLMNRIFNDFDPDTKLKYRQLLSRCILTTEHAVPFIFKGADSANSEIIILDDIIITGQTLNAVVSDINFLTGIEPEIWSLYCYERAMSPLYAGDIEIATGKFLSMNESREYLRILSNFIARQELPIDLEFPILHFGNQNAPSPDEVSDTMNRRFANSHRYVLNANEEDSILKSLNILLFSRLHDDVSPNMGKIRIFFAPGDIRIVVFAPRAILGQDLWEKELFPSGTYSSIWTGILSSITMPERPTYDKHNLADIQYRKYRKNTERSLAILANWLWSLSTAVGSLKDNEAGGCHITGETDGIHICPTDLDWLVGPALANAMAEKANNILNDGETLPQQSVKISVPHALYPEGQKENFIRSRVRIIKYSEDASAALNTIFTMANGMRRATIDDGLEVNDENEVYQTLRGLRYSLQFRFESSDLDYQLNEWLDKSIDSGLIIPRYQRASNTEGGHIWARYYKPSHFFQ